MAKSKPTPDDAEAASRLAGVTPPAGADLADDGPTLRSLPGGRGRPVDQLAFDEQVIDDHAIEGALEEREKRKDALNAVRKEYDQANAAATGAIARLELPEGGAARVGRFRIARVAVPARSVTFDTKASSRIRISIPKDA